MPLKCLDKISVESRSILTRHEGLIQTSRGRENQRGDWCCLKADCNDDKAQQTAAGIRFQGLYDDLCSKCESSSWGLQRFIKGCGRSMRRSPWIGEDIEVVRTYIGSLQLLEARWRDTLKLRQNKPDIETSSNRFISMLSVLKVMLLRDRICLKLEIVGRLRCHWKSWLIRLYNSQCFYGRLLLLIFLSHGAGLSLVLKIADTNPDFYLRDKTSLRKAEESKIIVKSISNKLW